MKIILSLAVIIATAAIFTNCSPSASSSSGSDSCQSSNFAYAVDTANNLLCFGLSTPATIDRTVALSGLAGSETIVGLDVRPSGGGLYALGSTGRLYSVNVSSGALTAVGSPNTYTSATTFGFDFNPTVDRIRVVTDNQLNMRLIPDTGAVAASDTTLAYNGSDTHVGATPRIVAAAYTNSVSGSVTTTLYDIDATLDTLVIQNPPNAGTLNTVGALGVDTDANTSFDIRTVSSTNTAYAVLTPAAGIFSSLYTVDLSTGAATFVNIIAGGNPIKAFAVAP